MKIIKRILIIIVAIIALPFIIALFVKNECAIEREIVIEKPREEVFAYVKNLKNEDNYNVWMLKDPTMKKTFTGTDGTVGCIYAWDGNDQVGAGEQEIKAIVEGERVDTELRFLRPFEGVANTYIATETISNKQTKIKYGMVCVNPYPMNFMNLLSGFTLGNPMEESLSLLKKDLEK